MPTCSLRFTVQSSEATKAVQPLPAARTVEVDLPDNDADRHGDVHSKNPTSCPFAEKEVKGHAGRDAASEPANEEASSKAPHESHATNAVHDPGQFYDSHRLPEPAGTRRAAA